MGRGLCALTKSGNMTDGEEWYLPRPPLGSRAASHIGYMFLRKALALWIHSEAVQPQFAI